MNDIRILHGGKSYAMGGYELLINGNKVSGVLEILPNLTPVDDIASVTITLAVAQFKFEPKPEE